MNIHKAFISSILIISLTFSCDKNIDNEFSKNDSISYLESILGITFDEDIEELVNDAFYSDLTTSKVPKKRFKKDKYGRCASIYDDEQNNTKIITFDGDCEGKKGQKRSGSIIVTYSGKKDGVGSFRQIDFDNFYLNDIKIEGVRRHEIINIENEVDKTIQISLENGKMIYPDGSLSTRSKNFTKVIKYKNDKQFSTSVTGNASGLDSGGSSFDMKIISPIIFLNKCSDQQKNKKGIIPVAGIKNITKNDFEIIIDFGDGECDSLADITKEGITETVDLRKVHLKKISKN
jgi:hypothetical protein|tara:strand:- start:781 stop:1650 length:870 start_codon:yes stop_codon:yes gene_type:complete